ncbi:hypothetical protein ACQJBY_026218 [Aegilops geniculata]
MSSTEKTNAAGGDKLSMKLLVNSKSQRVLYAEAGKDVVDFLFSLLTLPLGTVAKLIADENPAAGSVVNLYSSVDRLDDTYICRDNAKDDLLRPAGGCESGKLLQLPEARAPQTTLQIFRCNGAYSPNCRSYVTMVSGTPCGSCAARMTTQAQLVGSVGGAGSPAAAAGAAGFVQRIVTYTVMDDLKIAPMSTISGITILNTFGITDIGSLQEKTVQLGYAEGLEMLKASLQSKTVLTDVFLGKKRKASSP